MVIRNRSREQGPGVDPALARGSADYLRECGYWVIEASNSDEAVEVLREASIRVALMLASLHTIGSMDGLALAR